MARSGGLRPASARAFAPGCTRSPATGSSTRAAAPPCAPAWPPEAAHGEPGEIDRELEQAVLRWQVAAALARLSPEHREVIRLAHYGGLSLREISERKGIPLGTVKSRTSYALRTLRLILDEMEVRA